jgi:hypothetical protein
MTRLPLPEGITGISTLPRTQRFLCNCFNNLGGQIIARPGIVQTGDTGEAARGQFVWNNSLYQVSGNRLIKITSPTDGTYEEIGTIEGSENVITTANFNETTIAVIGGNIYTLDADDNLVDITDNDNIEPVNGMTSIDGRTIYVRQERDGITDALVYYSDGNNSGSVGDLSFFDAEEYTDTTNNAFNLKNTLYITGTDSIELFRSFFTQQQDDTPFRKVPGSRILNGYVGGLLEYNETFLFIGREQGQAFGIYAIVSGRAAKISNEIIDSVLMGYTSASLADATSTRFKWRGYDIAVFNLGDRSYGFLGGKWFQLETVRDGEVVAFGAKFINQLNGIYYTAFENRIGYLAAVSTDYGENIEKCIVTAIEKEDVGDISIPRLEIGVSQGYNGVPVDDPPGTISLSVSRIGVEFNDPAYLDLSRLGDYTKRLIFQPPGGISSTGGYLGLKLRTEQDVIFDSQFIDGVPK